MTPIIIAFLTVLVFYISSAIDIPINNFGFEDDGPLDDNNFYYDSNGLPSWTNWDKQELMDESVGVQNPTGGDAFNDPVFNDGVPQGTLSGYIEQVTADWNGEGELGIQQTLTGYTVEADTTYTLTAYVGNPSPNCWLCCTTEGELCFTPDGFPGYRVQLLGQAALLGEDDNSITIGEGEWAQSTVKVTITAGDSNIGKTLKIRLVNKNDADGGIEVGFDDVHLTAVPTAATTTAAPTKIPTAFPTLSPTILPTLSPTILPTLSPTILPTLTPIEGLTDSPSDFPSKGPTNFPSEVPTYSPTVATVTGDTETQLVPTKERLTTEESDKDDGDTTAVATPRVWEPYMTVVAVAIATFLGCLCVCMLYICYKAHHESEETLVDDVEIDDEKEEEEKEEVESNDNPELLSFFTHDLKLPQYYNVFIENGYDSLPALMAITSKEQLVDIGITMAGHISLILMKLQRLKNSTEGGADDTTTEEQTWQQNIRKVENVHEERENERNDMMEYEEVDHEMLKERRMVKLWFDDVVQLKKYKYDELFIQNGYETMKAVQTIKNKSEIKDIGVKILGHQTLILSEIEKLNSIQGMQQMPLMMQQAPNMMQMYGNNNYPQPVNMPIYEGNGEFSEPQQRMAPGMEADYEVTQIIEQQNKRMLQLQDSIDAVHENIDSMEATAGNQDIPQSVKQNQCL